MNNTFILWLKNNLNLNWLHNSSRVLLSRVSLPLMINSRSRVATLTGLTLSQTQFNRLKAFMNVEESRKDSLTYGPISLKNELCAEGQAEFDIIFNNPLTRDHYEAWKEFVIKANTNRWWIRYGHDVSAPNFPIIPFGYLKPGNRFPPIQPILKNFEPFRLVSHRQVEREEVPSVRFAPIKKPLVKDSSLSTLGRVAAFDIETVVVPRFSQYPVTWEMNLRLSVRHLTRIGRHFVITEKNNMFIVTEANDDREWKDQEKDAYKTSFPWVPVFSNFSTLKELKAYSPVFLLNSGLSLLSDVINLRNYIDSKAPNTVPVYPTLNPLIYRGERWTDLFPILSLHIEILGLTPYSILNEVTTESHTSSSPLVPYAWGFTPPLRDICPEAYVEQKVGDKYAPRAISGLLPEHVQLFKDHTVTCLADSIHNALYDLGHFIINHILVPQNHGLLIAVHNGGKFDFLLIVRALLRCNFPHRNIHIQKVANNKGRLILRYGGNSSSKHAFNVTFTDTLPLFMGMRLASLLHEYGLNKMGIEKLAFNHDEVTVNNYKEKFSRNYLVNDTAGLAALFALQQFNVLAEFKLDFSHYWTNAHFSWNVFLTREYNPRKTGHLINVTDEKWAPLLRAAYKGGRTEVFIPYAEDFYSYDISSSYPYQMTKPLPGNYARTYDIKRGLKNLFGFAVANVIIEKENPILGKIPCLPSSFKGEEGLFFPIGNFSGVWFREELKLAAKYGAKVQLIEAIEFDTVNTHESFINKFYALKSAYKNEKAKRAVVKGILNTRYGRMALNPTIDEISIQDFAGLSFKQTNYCSVSSHLLPGFSLDENSPLYFVRNRIQPNPELKTTAPEFYNRLMKKFNNKINKNQISVPAAAAITAYARIQLFDAMVAVGVGNVIACDTDSIKTRVPFPYHLGWLNNKLGGWVNELADKTPTVDVTTSYGTLIRQTYQIEHDNSWKYQYGIFFGIKTYMMYSPFIPGRGFKVALKGVAKKSSILDILGNGRCGLGLTMSPGTNDAGIITYNSIRAVEDPNMAHDTHNERDEISGLRNSPITLRELAKQMFYLVASGDQSNFIAIPYLALQRNWSELALYPRFVYFKLKIVYQQRVKVRGTLIANFELEGAHKVHHGAWCGTVPHTLNTTITTSIDDEHQLKALLNIKTPQQNWYSQLVLNPLNRRANYGKIPPRFTLFTNWVRELVLDLSPHFIEGKVNIRYLAQLLYHLMVQDNRSGQMRGRIIRQARLVRLTTVESYTNHWSKIIPTQFIRPFEEKTKARDIGEPKERERMRINLLTQTASPFNQVCEIIHKINSAINKGEYFAGISRVRVMLVIERARNGEWMIENTIDPSTVQAKEGLLESHSLNGDNEETVTREIPVLEKVLNIDTTELTAGRTMEAFIGPTSSYANMRTLTGWSPEVTSIMEEIKAATTQQVEYIVKENIDHTVSPISPKFENAEQSEEELYELTHLKRWAKLNPALIWVRRQLNLPAQNITSILAKLILNNNAQTISINPPAPLWDRGKTLEDLSTQLQIILDLPKNYSDENLLTTPEYLVAGFIVNHINKIGQWLNLCPELLNKLITFTILASLSKSEYLLVTQLTTLIYRETGHLTAKRARILNESLGILLPSLNSIYKFVQTGILHASNVSCLPEIWMDIKRERVKAGSNPLFLYFVPEAIAAFTTYIMNEKSQISVVHKTVMFLIKSALKNSDIEKFTITVGKATGLDLEPKLVINALNCAIYQIRDYPEILKSKEVPSVNTEPDYFAERLGAIIGYHATKACFRVLGRFKVKTGSDLFREDDSTQRIQEEITTQMARDSVEMTEHRGIMFVQPKPWVKQRGSQPWTWHNGGYLLNQRTKVNSAVSLEARIDAHIEIGRIDLAKLNKAQNVKLKIDWGMVYQLVNEENACENANHECYRELNRDIVAQLYAQRKFIDRFGFFMPTFFDMRLRLYYSPSFITPVGSKLLRKVVMLENTRGEWNLPIYLDARASGFQHLAMATRNVNMKLLAGVIGNFSSREIPDIYLETAYEATKIFGRIEMVNYMAEIAQKITRNTEVYQIIDWHHDIMKNRELPHPVIQWYLVNPEKHRIFSVLNIPGFYFEIKLNTKGRPILGRVLCEPTYLIYRILKANIINRQLAKMPVMTQLYNARLLTKTQHVEETLLTQFPEEPYLAWAAKGVITKALRAGFKNRCRPVVSLMELITLVRRQAELPFKVKHPTGSEITFVYKTTKVRTHRIPGSKKRLKIKRIEELVDWEKMGVASVANFVHRKDAAAFSLAVRNIDTFIRIHDRIGVNREDVGKVGKGFKSAYEELYNNEDMKNWLLERLRVFKGNKEQTEQRRRLYEELFGREDNDMRRIRALFLLLARRIELIQDWVNREECVREEKENNERCRNARLPRLTRHVPLRWEQRAASRIPNRNLYSPPREWKRKKE